MRLSASWEVTVSAGEDGTVVRFAYADGRGCVRPAGWLVTYTDRERDGPDSMRVEYRLPSGQLLDSVVVRGLGELPGLFEGCYVLDEATGGRLVFMQRAEWRVPREYASERVREELRREFLEVMGKIMVAVAFPHIEEGQGAARVFKLLEVYSRLLPLEFVGLSPHSTGKIFGTLAWWLAYEGMERRDPELVVAGALGSAIAWAPPARRPLLAACLALQVLRDCRKVYLYRELLGELFGSATLEIDRWPLPPDVAIAARQRLRELLRL